MRIIITYLLRMAGIGKFARHSSISVSSVMLLLSFLLITTDTIFSQGWGEKNTIFISGQVTNMINRGPVKHQQIFITNDTTYNPEFNYESDVYTNNEGFYYDTIRTALQKGAIKIFTFDDFHNYYETILYFRFT